MPKQTRFNTQYPGVYYIMSYSSSINKLERVYYIRYRQNDKLIEEKAGRQFVDNITAATANQIRIMRITGRESSNQQRRIDFEELQKGGMTIEKIWRQYKLSTTSSDGHQRAGSTFEKHLKDIFGNKYPQDLSKDMIDKFRMEKLKTYAPASVYSMLARLRIIINFGVESELCTTLSFKIKMPKVDNLKTEDLTKKQLKSLLIAISEDSDQGVANMMRLVLSTGMRRGELLNLEWTDIDFGKRFIVIRQPKGGKTVNIPMNKMAYSVLKKQKNSKDGDYVFPGRWGGKRVEIRTTLSRIKLKAKLPTDFRPLHGLRHVYASMLASSGKVDLYTLQKLLTHKSPEMTQRYAHLRDEVLKKASDLASELLTV